MISRNQSKEDSPNSYKHIHLKNINRINKQISENMSNKNIEYFPSGVRQ